MKNKILDASSIPPRINLWMPFILYTLVDYWHVPVWIFAVYMTTWVIFFLSSLWIYLSADKVKLNAILK